MKSSIVRILVIQAGILLLVAIPGIIAVANRHNIAVAYHKRGAIKTYSDMSRIASVTQPGEQYRQDYWRYHDRHDDHIDALKDLGYLERRDFSIDYLTLTSPQGQAMRKAYLEIYPDTDGSITNSFIHEGILMVTDRPERMNTVKALVKKYDIALIDPCQPNAPGPAATQRP